MTCRAADILTHFLEASCETATYEGMDEEQGGEVEMEGEVERQEVKLVMLMTIAKREKAEQANDRARVGNVNRQERRDGWARSGVRGMPR